MRCEGRGNWAREEHGCLFFILHRVLAGKYYDERGWGRDLVDGHVSFTRYTS